VEARRRAPLRGSQAFSGGSAAEAEHRRVVSPPKGAQVSKHRGAEHRRHAALLVLALGVSVVVAACGGGSGGSGVAQAGTPTTAGSSSHPSGKGSALAMAQCMRAHGVPDFPDPDSSGRIAIQGTPGSGLDPRSPQFQAAQQACKAFAPPGIATSGTKSRADLLKFSRCMRSHGLADFPDPGTQGNSGGIAITGGPGGDLDPNSPVFQAAQRACQHLMPGGGRGPRFTTKPST
jgi:hypothetical protein